ncbi:hypothetical protein CVV67_11540 [Arthrobacter stackebrandtii]|nr:hypothetical protein CVV67_11540 [Arthrobacter stackebrandtii]
MIRTTPAFRLPLLASVALVSALALGGCTSGGPAPATTLEAPTVTQLVPEPAVLQKGVECPSSLDDFPSNADTGYPATPRGSVPAGFVPDQVFICRPDLVTGVMQQEELKGDFAPLLAALAVPSDRAEGDGVACTMILEIIPVLWLVNAEGGAVDAAWPTTECRQASGKPDTQKAIDGLTVAGTTVVPGSGK